MWKDHRTSNFRNGRLLKLRNANSALSLYEALQLRRLYCILDCLLKAATRCGHLAELGWPVLSTMNLELELKING